MAKPTSFILYQGPSLLDGQPIVAIAVTKSKNVKTGNMVQTFIIRSDVDPMTAQRAGADVSVCGNCKHRPILGGACYVDVPKSVLSVYRAFLRGSYPDLGSLPVPASYEAIRALGVGRMVRLGSYGDPAAVPAHVWRALVDGADGHTGYTHQWAESPLVDQRDNLRTLVMASADNAQERAQAQAAGWRTFRVRSEDEAVLAGEFVCPASPEGGDKRTCATCGACNGAPRGTAQASAVIVVHGARAGRFLAQVAA